MSNAILIAFCLITAMAAVCYLAWKITYGKLQDERLKNAALERSVKQLEEESGRLREEMKLNAKREKETNEKVEELHTGDSVANAVNGLSKPRGGDGGEGGRA